LTRHSNSWDSAADNAGVLRAPFAADAFVPNTSPSPAEPYPRLRVNTRVWARLDGQELGRLARLNSLSERGYMGWREVREDPEMPGYEAYEMPTWQSWQLGRLDVRKHLQAEQQRRQQARRMGPAAWHHLLRAQALESLRHMEDSVVRNRLAPSGGF
jgi:hypothetical protein